MPDLHQTALDIEGLRLVRLDGLECVVLRIRGAGQGQLDRLGRSLDLPLQAQPNTTSGTSPRALSLAPGEWLLVSERPLTAAIARAAAELAGATHHFANVSHGQVVFSLSGPKAMAFIARACSLDLHPRVFPPGRCAQSLFAQIPVLIHHYSGGPTFHLYFDASFEAHLRTLFGKIVRSLETVTTP